MFGSLKKKLFKDKAGDNRTFKDKYIRFQELLDKNNEVLETLSALSEIRDRRQSVGLGRLRSLLTRTAVNVYRLIQNLNLITDDKYLILNDIFNELEKKITAGLTGPSQSRIEEWALPLEEVDRGLAGEVGSKAANLGEIIRSRAASVPRGVVFTSYAYMRFMENKRLQERINKENLSVDPDNYDTIERAGGRIRDMILSTPLPLELEDALENGYRRVMADRPGGGPVVMRSSAVGEDELGRSFAGLFSSIINPGAKNLAEAYKEVVASKYSSRAIAYCFRKGIYQEFFPMSVLLMELAPAEAAGVVFSRDPAAQEKGMLVHAVWGLGKPVVDGSGDPDQFWISRTTPPELTDRLIGTKTERLDPEPVRGMSLTEENESRRREPCLSRDRLFDLASIQLRLEKLLGGPLDTEWVLSPDGTIFIVQSRPLALEQKSDTWKALYPGDEVDGNYPVLAEGMDVASTGAASGKPVFINRLSKISGLSAGTVLVVTDTSPHLTGALNKAAAVVAEKGSSTGHLAIIAREFHVPVLVGLPGHAREMILSRPEITIDAYTGRIFAGRAEPLLEMASALKSRENAQELLPARKLLNEVLGYVTPLNLIDPRSPSFRPQSIRTIHDIIRFAHETAINAMFDINDSRQIAKGVVRRLVSNVPLDINIIDLDGGLRETAAAKKVYPEDIISIPMRALYQGMITDGVRWSGHVPIDFKGFLSVWANTMYDASKYERRLGDRSYAIVSANYLNFASRLGYHFSILDAYAGPVENENYISFRFKGGAASLEKRTRRVCFIQKVLEKHDFWVDQKADLVNARIKRLALAGMEERLVMLGRLMGCSRQLDVTMHSDIKVDEYVQRFMDGEYSMGHRDPGSADER